MLSAVQGGAASIGVLLQDSLWAAYKSPLAQKLGKAIFPDHTRDAFFQLVCGLRCNAPKDGKFWQKHLTALKPRTFTGWLAMATGVLYAGAGLAVVSSAACAGVVALLWAAMFAFVSVGLSLAGVFSVFSFFLVLGALGLSFTAFGFASGYCFSAAAQRAITLTWNVSRLLVDLSSPQPQRGSVQPPAPAKKTADENVAPAAAAKGKAAKGKAAHKAASPHDALVEEALRVVAGVREEKQNSTQLVGEGAIISGLSQTSPAVQATQTTQQRHLEPPASTLFASKKGRGGPPQKTGTWPRGADPQKASDLLSALEAFRGSP